jgi:hypothetical protein
MILNEGGGVFADAQPFDHSDIPAIMKQINSVLSKLGVTALPIGSGASPTPGKTSGDLDMIVDADTLANQFKTPDVKAVRKQLRDLFDRAGFQTGQSGVSVHVRTTVGDSAQQVDIMTVPKAEIAQKFHVHDIPKGSPYKGVHKHMALSKLAKNQGLLWSPYEGLWTRGPDNKKHKFYTDDLDKIAQTLLGPDATGNDLSSLENIMKTLPDGGKALLQDLEKEKTFQKKLVKTETLSDKNHNRIKELLRNMP